MNTKVPSTGSQPNADSASGVNATASAPSNAASCYAVDEETSSQLAKEELNLLAKLIGGNEADGGSGKDTFKLNLFDICGSGGGGTEKHGYALRLVDDLNSNFSRLSP